MSKKRFIDGEEERLLSILDAFGDEFVIAIEDRAKLCAANFLLAVGAKATLQADGYLAAVVQITPATIVKLIDEGYLDLSEKGKASQEDIQAIQAARSARQASSGSLRADDGTGGPGAYL